MNCLHSCITRVFPCINIEKVCPCIKKGEGNESREWSLKIIGAAWSISSIFMIIIALTCPILASVFVIPAVFVITGIITKGQCCCKKVNDSKLAKRLSQTQRESRSRAPATSRPTSTTDRDASIRRLQAQRRAYTKSRPPSPVQTSATSTESARDASIRRFENQRRGFSSSRAAFPAPAPALATSTESARGASFKRFEDQRRSYTRSSAPSPAPAPATSRQSAANPGPRTSFRTLSSFFTSPTPAHGRAPPAQRRRDLPVHNPDGVFTHVSESETSSDDDFHPLPLEATKTGPPAEEPGRLLKLSEVIPLSSDDSNNSRGSAPTPPPRRRNRD